MKKINEIKGLENIREIYYVTKEGKIISVGNYGSKKLGEPKELKQYTKTGGYLNVALMTNDAKVKYMRAHRIVALAFIENPENKPYTNHIDLNRQNNHYLNLEWVTPKENNHHSLIKKTYVYNLDGELIKIYKYTRECVDDGFNQGHVCSCARNEIKSHKKHIFSYKPLTKNEIVQRLSKPYYLN